MTVSKLKQIRSRLLSEGLDLSGKQLLPLIKEFNNWELPISQRMTDLAAGKQVNELNNFIKTKINQL